MEKETKDALIFFAPIVLVILVVGVFIAVENTNVDFDFDKYFLKDSADAGIYGEIDGAVWATSIVNFFGWENTWASFIMGLAVLIMLYAALYEILGFTNFEKEWVKQVIAIAIAVIIAVSRGVVVIAAFFLALAGESIILATLVAILIAIVFLLLELFLREG